MPIHPKTGAPPLGGGWVVGHDFISRSRCKPSSERPVGNFHPAWSSEWDIRAGRRWSDRRSPQREVSPVAELSLLFVEPTHIGTGVGRRLFEHAAATARTAGFDGFTIDADPYAEDFYRAMGAIRTGVAPSSVRPGRELPRLTFTVASG